MDIKQIAEAMSSEDLIFTYQGIVNKDIVSDILTLAENALKVEQIENKLRKKLFRVLLEGIQNLYKHQTHHPMSEDELQEVTTVLLRDTDGYQLILGNYINCTERNALKERIDIINSHDIKELRKKYIEKLSDNERTKEGGSGLGLMDMARKTSEPLSYEFTDVNSDVCYFKLIVKINKSG